MGEIDPHRSSHVDEDGLSCGGGEGVPRPVIAVRRSTATPTDGDQREREDTTERGSKRRGERPMHPRRLAR